MNKEHILSEIKRTADKNHGVPLGIDRFREETGISKQDWYGIFWAKWTDAQVEAGFEPNQFGTPEFDEEWLLNEIALYIRELGHFPTQPELMLRKKQNSDFPSRGTLRNRLGTKDEIVKKVLEYCRSNEEWKDVVSLCLDVQVSPTPTGRSNQTKDITIGVIGHVYLLKHNKVYKIGRSKDASRRYREIRTQMPYQTEEIHVIETDDPVGIEAYWHNRFKDKRLEGEWFELSLADVKAFKRMRCI